MNSVDKYLTYLAEAEGWKGTPKGWKRSSIKRFAKSLTGKEGVKIGFFDRCVKKMKGKVFEEKVTQYMKGHHKRW